MATYTKINEFGFLETPYLRVYHEAENNASKLMNRILNEDMAGQKKGAVIDEKIARTIAKTKNKKTIKVKPWVSHEIDYINATVEDRKNITHAGVAMDEHGNILPEVVGARVKGRTTEIEAKKLDYIDVSAKQCISVATSLIPFLEHDDANRALMGSNMQRQAVSCVKPMRCDCATCWSRIIHCWLRIRCDQRIPGRWQRCDH